ncbi:MAG: OsmC family protein, partial [Ilumatobacteraceae bacterium]
MSTASHRSVRLERLGFAHFRATNPTGATIEFGAEDLGAFTPVELLLAAIGGCSAIDVDYIVVKRDEPTAMEVTVTAEKVRDTTGNHLVDIHLTLEADFADIGTPV